MTDRPMLKIRPGKDQDEATEIGWFFDSGCIKNIYLSLDEMHDLCQAFKTGACRHPSHLEAGEDAVALWKSHRTLEQNLKEAAK